jgi:hypothetical protein
MNQTLVTQTALQPVQAALNEVATNLAAHANATLSKAHGINMLQFAPNSITDSDGNDISVYYDDHGDVIGTVFVTFVVNDVVYYAPANLTALAPQSPSTGVGVYGGSSSGSGSGSGSGTIDSAATWITDVISQETSEVNLINTEVLIPHTQKGYWEVHGDMTAIEQTTFDSIGHIVGNFVIVLFWGGNTYQIPCTNRLGGMLQPPWSLPFTPITSAYFVIGPDDNSHVYNFTIYASGTNPGLTPWSQYGGNEPLALTWYTQDQTGAWNAVASGESTVPFSNAGNTLTVFSDSNSFTFYQTGLWTAGLTRILNVTYGISNSAGTLNPAGLFIFTVFKNTNY